MKTHDEALVERVAQAIGDANGYAKGWTPCPLDSWSPACAAEFRAQARAAIYPPKTKLEVARGLLAKARLNVGANPNPILEGRADESSDMQAVLAALSLPAMEH